MKKLVALALGTVMAVSMTAGVSAATVESKDDLKNATIGVQLGTTGDIEASEYEADGATVKRYSKGSEAIQALMAGQIDCVIIDSQPAQKFVENADGLKILDEPFEFEPYEYRDGDEIVGIDADIAQAICDKLGYELEIDDMEFDAILAAVQSGKADFGAAGMTVTEDRLESVDFTDTYANASQVIIVKAD